MIRKYQQPNDTTKNIRFDNDLLKETTTSEIKKYYDTKEFNSKDVYDISKAIGKEDELFNYADMPSYYKTKKTRIIKKR